jgi:hypothetical protein
LTRGYRIAEVTIDWEDYLWNSPYARCVDRKDKSSIDWLHDSYLKFASQYVDADRAMAETVFGRKVDHVLLLHLGAFSSAILPDLIKLLREKSFTFATLEEAQADSIFASDPKAGSKDGGTLLEQWLDARRQKYPEVPLKPYKDLERICQ